MALTPNIYYVSLTGRNFVDADEIQSHIDVMTDAVRTAHPDSVLDSSLSRAHPQGLGEANLGGQSFADCMRREFDAIDRADTVIFLANSALLGEGQLLEFGYTVALRKQMILAKSTELEDSWFDAMVEHTVRYESLSDLRQNLQSCLIEI